MREQGFAYWLNAASITFNAEFGELESYRYMPQEDRRKDRLEVELRFGVYGPASCTLS